MLQIKYITFAKCPQSSTSVEAIYCIGNQIKGCSCFLYVRNIFHHVTTSDIYGGHLLDLTQLKFLLRREGLKGWTSTLLTQWVVKHPRSRAATRPFQEDGEAKMHMPDLLMCAKDDKSQISKVEVFVCWLAGSDALHCWVFGEEGWSEGFHQGYGRLADTWDCTDRCCPYETRIIWATLSSPPASCCSCGWKKQADHYKWPKRTPSHWCMVLPLWG